MLHFIAKLKLLSYSTSDLGVPAITRQHCRDQLWINVILAIIIYKLLNAVESHLKRIFHLLFFMLSTLHNCQWQLEKLCDSREA